MQVLGHEPARCAGSLRFDHIGANTPVDSVAQQSTLLGAHTMHQKVFGLTVAMASVAATLVIGSVAGAAAPSTTAGTVVTAGHHTATSAGKTVKRAQAKHRATPKAASPRLTSGTSSTSSASYRPRLKPVLTGLLNRQGVPPAAYRSSEGGYDIQGTQDDQGNPDVGDVSWAELQPTAGGPIAGNNAIDLAVADVRAWNAANPTHPEALKLRVAAGIHSPSWALDLGGACVAVTDPPQGRRVAARGSGRTSSAPPTTSSRQRWPRRTTRFPRSGKSTWPRTRRSTTTR